ncbi:MAG: glucose-1-phosphate thymidylyltransferase, partial [Bacteroidia bacterium]|nr:glucose-1-phosphate thymidylyltransferase [Bacteroidia bacterium]
MNYILFDDALRINLLPFTYTRPCAAIRTGILTISEKWERHLNTEISYLTMDYLQGKFPIYLEEENIYINGRLLPDADILPDIMSLKPGQALCLQDVVLAYNTHVSDVRQLESAILLNSIHQIFTLNPSQIESDFKLITKDKTSASLSATNTVIGNHPVFLEEGVKAECAIFNTTDGPIYLGFESEVMEGAIIRGPFALCEHAGVKMGAKIYSGTTVGPHSKVGGEISNSVILGYSNKGHDGFLGNSVIGEWCNIGADSNNS